MIKYITGEISRRTLGFGTLCFPSRSVKLVRGMYVFASMALKSNEKCWTLGDCRVSSHFSANHFEREAELQSLIGNSVYVQAQSRVDGKQALKGCPRLLILCAGVLFGHQSVFFRSSFL